MSPFPGNPSVHVLLHLVSVFIPDELSNDNKSGALSYLDG